MRIPLFIITSASLFVVALCPPVASAADTVDQATLDKFTAGWAERPTLALHQMMFKYGAPQEATPMTVIWRNAGPFKCITLMNEETPHSFPKPHVDFLRHSITMKVPAEKADELMKFDGSNSFSRTEGVMSACCDSEAHNVLTLNLIHDIVEGKTTVAEARKTFDKCVVDDLKGEDVPCLKALQFDPATTGGPDPDKVTITGASLPLGKEKRANPDAEILCVVAAIDENEILAAEEAEQRKVNPAVLAFAKMMHTEHGKNLDMLMKLGEKTEIRPTETTKTDALRVKGAGELATLVPLDGDGFAKAYIDAMVKGHTEALATIDEDLLKNAENREVKQFLTETRDHVAHHLDEATKLQTRPATER